MRLLPFETIVIETSLTKEETLASLERSIEPEKAFRFFDKSNTGSFEGQLSGNEFEIKRIIGYRNSFLPIIKGRIEANGAGARLTVKMRLHFAVMIFMAIWFGGVGLFFLASLLTVQGRHMVLFPLGMLLFGYTLTISAYLFESNKAKEILTDITKGKVVGNTR